jgi:hypothetical protein
MVIQKNIPKNQYKPCHYNIIIDISATTELIMNHQIIKLTKPLYELSFEIDELKVKCNYQ